jgi:hypothetical protein
MRRKNSIAPMSVHRFLGDVADRRLGCSASHYLATLDELGEVSTVSQGGAHLGMARSQAVRSELEAAIRGSVPDAGYSPRPRPQWQGIGEYAGGVLNRSAESFQEESKNSGAPSRSNEKKLVPSKGMS